MSLFYLDANRFVGIEKHGNSLASCIFSVVQLVVGSPRCGFRDNIVYNGLICQSPKLALQVVADTASLLHTLLVLLTVYL